MPHRPRSTGFPIWARSSSTFHFRPAATFAHSVSRPIGTFE